MNIFSELNKQASLDDIICLQDITSEQQLKKLQSEGYQTTYTRQTWEQAYPGIPAKNIYCLPSRIVPADLMYMDFDHYIFFHTRIYGEEFLSLNGIDFPDAAQKQIEQGLKDYQDRKYLKLLYPICSENSGNMVLQILQHMLEREKPSASLYDAFLSLYSFVDYGASSLSNEAMQKLASCKSKAQKTKTQKAIAQLPEEIIVYRGEGSESTPYSKTYSWTTDINTAAFFAGRQGGENAKLISAKVRKENVLEYITDKRESEILVMPEHVYDAAVRKLTTLDWFLKVITSALPKFTEKELAPYSALALKERAEKLYTAHGKDSGDHDRLHTCRVALFASYLYRDRFLINNFYNQKKSALLKQYATLMDAVIYHDIGRTDDSANTSHGASGYLVYEQDHDKDPLVQFLIENHCVDDDVAYERLINSNLTDKHIAQELFNILKDADALDRWRFNGLASDTLNVSMLRSEEAFGLIAVAAKLQQVRF